MREDLASLREEYTKASLDEHNADEDPFKQFEKWFQEAKSASILEPNAMVVSTVSQNGIPSQRTVLLKDLTGDGFVFYSNYGSRKGQEIAENENVSLLFPWYALERQIIIQGCAQKLSGVESEKYFQSRPKGSQIGALVSNQSEQINSREILEKKKSVLEEQFKDQEIPMPTDWGGYLVVPTFFEFWQGRKSRLHDRIVYSPTESKWQKGRLSP